MNIRLIVSLIFFIPLDLDAEIINFDPSKTFDLLVAEGWTTNPFIGEDPYLTYDTIELGQDGATVNTLTNSTNTVNAYLFRMFNGAPSEVTMKAVLMINLPNECGISYAGFGLNLSSTVRTVSSGNTQLSEYRLRFCKSGSDQIVVKDNFQNPLFYIQANQEFDIEIKGSFFDSEGIITINGETKSLRSNTRDWIYANQNPNRFATETRRGVSTIKKLCIATNGDDCSLLPNNTDPVLDPVQTNYDVLENQFLSIPFNATDAEDDALTYSITNNPIGSSLIGNVFEWTPSFEQSGTYQDIEITVTDSGTPTGLDSQLFSITVGNVNRVPSIDPISEITVEENNSVSFQVITSDPDGDEVSLSVSSLPEGSQFDSLSGSFDWIPNYLQSGLYNLTFTATDSIGASSEYTVVINVNNTTNQCGLAEYINDQIVTLPISDAVQNSYIANMKKVCDFVTQGKFKPAINQVDSFLQKIGQDLSQSRIDSESGSILESLGLEMRELLN